MNKTLLGYVPEESPIYAIHPFVKLFFLLVVSLFPMFIAAPEFNALLMLLIIFLMWFSKISMSTLKIYIPVMISMGSIILISYTVLGGTHPEYFLLARPLGVNIYWERIRDALVVYFRVLPMVFTMVFFLSTSRERDVIVAMRSMRAPFLVTYIFAMALRSAGMVLEDFQVIRQAERARGFDTAGRSIIYRVRKYIMYMIPLFAVSLRRAEEFTNALIARGFAFTGKTTKTKRADFILTHYTFTSLDMFLTIVVALSFIGILIGRYAYQYFGVDSSLFLQWLYPILT